MTNFSDSAFVSDGGYNQGWSPISPLVRHDGDTSLFLFTANSVVYGTQILDPFFLALYNVSEATPGPGNSPAVYLPSIPVSAMVCVDQYLIRNPNNQKNTSMISQISLNDAIQALNFSVAQSVTAQRLIHYFSNTDTYSSVYGSGPSALKASDSVLNLISSGLPFNQWRTEVEGWFETSLAKLQAYTVEYAANTADLGPYGSIEFLNSNTSTLPTWQNQCRNQKISNTGQYQTFSFFGLVFTAAVGAAIIIMSFLLPMLISCLRRRGDGFAKSEKEVALVADGKFQLQRMMFESMGYGSWRNVEQDYPWRMDQEGIPNPDGRGGLLYPRCTFEDTVVQKGSGLVEPSRSPSIQNRQSIASASGGVVNSNGDSGTKESQVPQPEGEEVELGNIDNGAVKIEDLAEASPAHRLEANVMNDL
jgi:hypothetical protein